MLPIVCGMVVGFCLSLSYARVQETKEAQYSEQNNVENNIESTVENNLDSDASEEKSTPAETIVEQNNPSLYTVAFYDQNGNITITFKSYENADIEVPAPLGSVVTSFQLNGVHIDGNIFKMPAQNAAITNIQIAR